jgi:hypothetical protein
MAMPTKIAGFTKHGKFYTVTQPTNAVAVSQLIAAIREEFTQPGARKEMVWILSGTHGNTSGELSRERDFFYEDKLLEGQIYKSTDVWSFTKPPVPGVPAPTEDRIIANRWNTYTSKTGIVILAWCYSEQSRTGWMKRAKLTGV